MKSIIVLTLVLFAAFNNLAQEKIISQTEFEDIYQTSSRNLAGKSYRTITNYETTIIGNPLAGSSSKFITEFQPNVGHRSVSESRFRFPSAYTERIVIGDKIYTREGNGRWKVARHDPNAETPGNLPDLISNKTEYKYLGSEKLNNQTTNIYLKIERKRLFSKSTDKESLDVSTTKYWFAETGELLRAETVTERDTEGRAIKSKSITVYELDPNIKIKAPIQSLIKN